MMLLEVLKRTKSFNHPDAKDLVINWHMQREGEVEKSENTLRAGIIFEIDRADLYMAIENTEGAIQCLEDALTQVNEGNQSDLFDEIDEKLIKLSSTSHPEILERLKIIKERHK